MLLGAGARGPKLVDLYGSQILDQPPYELICCSRGRILGCTELVPPHWHRPCSVGHVYATPIDDAAHVLRRKRAAMAPSDARQIRDQDLELRGDGAIAETRVPVAASTEALIELRAPVARQICRPSAILHEQQCCAERQTEPQSAQRNARRPASRSMPRSRDIAQLFVCALSARMSQPSSSASRSPSLATSIASARTVCRELFIGRGYPSRI